MTIYVFAVKDLFERTEQELYAAREKASIRPAKGQVKTLFPAPEADIHVQMKIKVKGVTVKLFL